jgi:hypothetical protein
MTQQPGPQDPLVISYLSMRKVVGVIACALPLALAFGKILLQGPGIEGSISYYYYTDMRGVFVGSLCAMAVFLGSCRGYDRRDEVAGWLACAFAIGVAMFPTRPYVGATHEETVIGAVHLSCAALLFLTLAYFCLALFTQTDPGKTPTPRKLQRNTVYRVCGTLILVCISLIVVVSFPAVNARVWQLTPVFWLESTAVISFGFSWLTKGETILKDQ